MRRRAPLVPVAGIRNRLLFLENAARGAGAPLATPYTECTDDGAGAVLAGKELNGGKLRHASAAAGRLPRPAARPISCIYSFAAQPVFAMWDRLFIDANIAAMTAGGPPYGAIKDGAVAEKDGRIAWIGKAADLPGDPLALAATVDHLGGAWITPGLIDCHTHLVFAGDRAAEFEARLNGASYEEIARAGGGINATVKATRAATLEALTAKAKHRLGALARAGVTTVEVKSGYGLSAAHEIKMLEAATHAGRALGMRVSRTFLAMHALPPEFETRRDAYVRLVIEEMLPEAHAKGVVDAVDAFCERIAFTTQEVRRLFDAARALGLPVKLHAEQLSDCGGAGLAAEFGALSADHLEYVNDSDIAAMARAGTIAVLLPGAFYFLKETKKPPVEKFREHGVRIAVASDFNPGSSPVSSPNLVMNMAATLFGLTPEEALAGMTRNAAAALGLSEIAGTLEAGKAADLAIWRISAPAELSYWAGGLVPDRVFAGGREIACL